MKKQKKFRIIGNGTDNLNHIFEIGQTVILLKDKDENDKIDCSTYGGIKKGKMLEQFIDPHDIEEIIEEEE